jgi:hypothetical protein
MRAPATATIRDPGRVAPLTVNVPPARRPSGGCNALMKFCAGGATSPNDQPVWKGRPSLVRPVALTACGPSARSNRGT